MEKVLFEKLTVTQSNAHAFYGTRRFIVAFPAAFQFRDHVQHFVTGIFLEGGIVISF
jgi:hypothetical protein